LGRFDENGNLVYVGRANDMVKINGNRIEPAEIEAVGKEVLGIDWCAAKGFVEQNSYIALYYKEDITFDEEEVRKKMEEKLPYYMIPTYFIKIDEVPLTATGKFNRKALPKPAAKVNFAEYVAPTNEMEEKLCNAFAKVLNLQRVGINDDFYQLGGDSLTSMQVMGEINSDYLTAEDLFKGRTAAKTAELYYENEKESGGTPWTETEMDSRKKEFELTGVQKSYVEEMLREEGKLSADISRLIELPLAIGAEKICAGMNMMVRNRPIWGTVFFKNDEGKLMQKFDESKVPTVQVEKMTQEEFEKIKHDLVPVYEPFDNILGSARVIETEEHIYAFISMSHAKVDGFAARKFFGDILDLYRGKELELDSYYSVLEKNRKDKMSSGYEEAKGYNDDRYGKDDWLRCLPGDGDGVDHKRAFDGRPLSFTIEDIEKAETRLGASRNEIFAAITLVAISKMTGNLKPMINWTYQDRGDKMKQNACGLVMKRLPIAVNMMSMTDIDEGLKNIKDQIYKGMAYSSYEWVCENENDLTDDVMSFVYQPYGIMNTEAFSAIGARLVEDALPRIGTARRCAFMVVEQKDNVIGLVNYMEGFYSKEYIDKFHGIYNAVASEVIRGGQ
ncbi:MAG: hypothetical protein K5644_09290, partial [Lachnospiraceae bacterium]|nr:hypothetical protein [Lachnospiraceae bacterium]